MNGNMTRRFLAVLLAVVLVFQSAPMVFASTEPDAGEAVETTATAAPENGPEAEEAESLQKTEQPAEPTEAPEESEPETPAQDATEEPALTVGDAELYATSGTGRVVDGGRIYRDSMMSDPIIYFRGKEKVVSAIFMHRVQADGDTTNKIAYCINPVSIISDEFGYTDTEAGMDDSWIGVLTRQETRAVGLALLYGYPNNSDLATDDWITGRCYEAATQIIIWEFLCGLRSLTAPYACTDTRLIDAFCHRNQVASAIEILGTDSGTIKKAYDIISAALADYNVYPSFASPFASNAPTYTLTKNADGSYGITLTDTNNSLGKCSFTNREGLTFSVSGNALTVRVANASHVPTGAIKNVKNVPDLEQLTVLIWEKPGNQELVSMSDSRPDPMPIYFKLKIPDGSLNIKKESTNGGTVEGWRFEVRKDSASGTLIGTYTTDANGDVTIPNLVESKYYVQEVGGSAYDGAYWTMPEGQTVTVSAGQAATVRFVNEWQGAIEIVKRSTNGGTVSGWNFEIRENNASGALVGTYTTDASGKLLITNLKHGTYYVQETGGSAYDVAYWTMPAGQTITVVDGQTASVTFTNIVQGRLQIVKTSEDGLVEGIPFVITGPNGYRAEGKTDADGCILLTGLEPGEYTVHEETPVSYVANGDTVVTVSAGTTAVADVTNVLKKIRVEVIKEDRDLDGAQGDATLDGAVYGLYTEDDQLVAQYTTADGCFITDAVPCKNYYIQELVASEGYQLDTTKYPIKSSAEDVTVEVTAIPLTVKEKVETWALKIHKQDADTGDNVQGTGTFEGAEFTVYNWSKNPVLYLNKEVAAGAVVAVIKTDANGDAELKNLPYATYRVVETAAPTGYVNSGFDQVVTLHDRDLVVTVKDQVIRGGLLVRKESRESSRFTIAGTVLTVYNVSGVPVRIGDDVFENDAPIMEIVTDDTGIAATAEDALPFGMYLVRETKAPQGYELNTDWFATITIREAGVVVAAGSVLVEQPSRGDLRFEKVDGFTGEAIPNVVFRLTNTDTNEVHYYVTDEDGILDTSKAAHSFLTNANDKAVDKEGRVEDTLLNSQAGLWFFGTADGTSTPDDTVGALPLGHYKITELRCEANKQYRLVEFECDITENDKLVDLGEQKDYEPEEIRTVLVDKDTREHFSVSDDIVTLYDTVYGHNLIPGKEYIINGVLMDRNTNLPLVDKEGNQITATYTFVATARDMELTDKLVFTFDRDLITYTTVVAFETLTDATGTVWAVHEDIQDDEQSVGFPVIHTTAGDTDGSKYVFGSTQTVIRDTIQYRELQVGRTYTFTGTLVDKQTGKAIQDKDGNTVTASTTQVIETSSGAVVVEFVFDATSVTGSTLVVYEKVTLEGVTDVVASHEDRTDEAQTVYIPKIQTTASPEYDPASKTLPVGPDTMVTDLVMYYNLQPGAEYTVSGTLCFADTGDAVIINGSAVTASTTFKAEAVNDFVVLDFVLDTTGMEGKAFVVKETLTSANGKKLAEETTVPNEAQTVYVPEIHTNAMTKDGGKESIAAPDVKIIDRVSYKNLSAGSRYIIRGALMNRDTGRPLLDENGEPIVSVVYFTAEDTEGYIDVPFEIDATQLLETTLVVYEELYGKDTLGRQVFLTEHKDMADDEQSIRFSKIGTSITGDRIMEPVGTVSFTDVIHVTKAVPGTLYFFRGILMDKTIGEPLVDEEGNTVVVESSQVAPAEEFDHEMVFTLDTERFTLQGKAIVCYEYMYTGNVGGLLIASHEDIEDMAQTMSFPAVHTTATGKDGEKVIEVTAPTDIVKIDDLVEMTGLVPGLQYEVTGTLMNKATGEPVCGEDGIPVTQTVSFVADEASAAVHVVFQVKAELVKAKQLSVVETLSYNAVTIGEHKDLNDEGQSVSVTSYGTLYKYDATTGEPLAGAKIQLTDETTGTVQVFTTDENGNILFAAYPGHTYSYVELEAPEGYIRNEDVFHFTVLEDGTIEGDTDLLNVRTGTAVIRKVDSVTGEPLAGAELGIYTEDGKTLLFSQVSDRFGRIYFFPGDMVGQTFALKEIKAPDGYYLDEELYTFHVDKDFTVTGTTMIANTPVGTVVIRKYSTDGTRLPGAKLAIYDDKDVLILQDTTDEYGRIYFTPQRAGTYYFVEVEAPNGYILSTEKHYFRVTENNQVIGETKLYNRPVPTPSTGDPYDPVVLMVLMAVSGMAFPAVLYYRKKRKI